jgi:hypothetical protein
MFLNCSTCFGRHTAHHQELKKYNCSLWFYIRFWLPVVAAMAEPSQRQPKTYVKPEAAITVFELLMMGGMSPCWAIKKHWNNKFYYTVTSCWFFLSDLCWDARIREHQIYKYTACNELNQSWRSNICATSSDLRVLVRMYTGCSLVT